MGGVQTGTGCGRCGGGERGGCVAGVAGGWGRVFYVHLAWGSVHELVELARGCLGEQAQGVERVRFERGGRERDRGMREVALVDLLSIKD